MNLKLNNVFTSKDEEYNNFIEKEKRIIVNYYDSSDSYHIQELPHKTKISDMNLLGILSKIFIVESNMKHIYIPYESEVNDDLIWMNDMEKIDKVLSFYILMDDNKNDIMLLPYSINITFIDNFITTISSYVNNKDYNYSKEELTELQDYIKYSASEIIRILKLNIF